MRFLNTELRSEVGRSRSCLPANNANAEVSLRVPIHDLAVVDKEETGDWGSPSEERRLTGAEVPLPGLSSDVSFMTMGLGSRISSA